MQRLTMCWLCSRVVATGTIDYASVADLGELHVQWGFELRRSDYLGVASVAGFGLSDLAIRSLDVIHSTTGLPWWATIIATTVAVRTAFFPVTVISVGPFSDNLLAVMREGSQLTFALY
ncbi:unnamed protein product [Phytophthora fragariaefolia]|uniref:Unnamed protein product n=1 Tax=Phytophthora fragariaefolia TaxID=1490495 RepID=A0A9W6WIJ7_9STRA|nr:unnamed protein product [Phytophthora fragariaefolia]